LSCTIFKNFKDSKDAKNFKDPKDPKDPKDADELRRRMRNIWNCHLERLVYNKMYTKYFGPQTLGHKYQKDHVERDLFETCFPLIEFAILFEDIVWTENVPITLILKYKKLLHNTDDQMQYAIVTETYKRTVKDDLYGLDVYCERLVLYPNGQNRIWTKVVAFHNKNTLWNSKYKSDSPDFGTDPWTMPMLKYKSKLILKW
jgi:hypothetical protein